jgi:hypothetical protein
MRSTTGLLLILLAQVAVFPPSGRAQTNTGDSQSKIAVTPDPDSEQKNLTVYIDLLRKNVRQQKAEIMGSVMVLDADDAAKFWPIYAQYDAALTKLNDQRAANIKEYARSYTQMTDAKADELIQNAWAYQRQREELLAKTYEQVKAALGATTAARFAQVEHQLLLLIDLQIVSALPVVQPAS